MDKSSYALFRECFMSMRFIFFLFAFLFLNCNTKTIEKKNFIATKGVLNLEDWNFTRDGTVELVGEWEFYWNELIENSDEQKTFFKNYNSSKLNYIPVPSEWQNYEVNGHKLSVDGYAMYRLKVIMPSDKESFSFSMTDVCSAYSIYINGVYYFGRGKVGKTKEETIPILRYGTFPLKENAKELEIVILISNFHHGKAGFWNKLSLGHSIEIENNLKNKIAIGYFTFGALFIMGIYHLLLFLLRRKDKSPLYFGLFCIILTIRLTGMEERPLMDIFSFIPFMTFYKLEYITMYLALPIFMLFVHSLFPEEFSRKFLRLILFTCIPATVLVFFSSPKMYATWLLLIIQILLLVSIVYSEYVLVIGIIRHRMGAISFLMGTFIFYVTLVNDVLYGMNIIHTTHIASYGFLVFIFSQSIILSIRFSNAFTISEHLAEELEEKSNSLLESNIELNNLKEGLEVSVKERTKILEDIYQKNLLEEQKVAKLKAEIFSIQERENLFFDIHDHIKGDVSELGLLLEKVKDYPVPIDISGQASSLLKKIASSVKNRMLMLEDKQLLESNFSSGLQMSLLRRYTALDRRFIFEMDELAESKIGNSATEFKNIIYSIATEISNNDLKYGFGESFWKIEVLDLDKILLEMKSNSNFNGSLDTGKGKMGIWRKVTILKGNLQEEVIDGAYKIRITVPI